MQSLFEMGLSNALTAAVLAVGVFLVTRFWKNRFVAHALWLIVLIKLVTPPLWTPPLLTMSLPGNSRPVETTVADAAVDIPSASAPLETVDPFSAEMHVEAVPFFEIDEATDESILVENESSPYQSETAFHVPMPPETQRPSSILPIEQTSHVEPTIVPTPPVEQSTALPVFAAMSWTWTAGAILCLLVVAYRVIRFQRLIRRTRLPHASLVKQISRLAQQVGLAKVPDVRLVEAAITPMVWPVSRRRLILLPKRLVTELNDVQLSTVLMHELVHIKRRDHWVRFLEVLVGAVYWWHPLVWWVRREIRAAEEDCCDSQVIRLLPLQRREYGEALLRTVELMTARYSPPLLASVFGQTPSLKRRVQMILEDRLQNPLSRSLRVLLLLFAAAVLPMAAWAVAEDEPAPATAAQDTTSPVADTADEAIQATSDSTSPVESNQTIREGEAAVELPNAGPVVAQPELRPYTDDEKSKYLDEPDSLRSTQNKQVPADSYSQHRTTIISKLDQGHHVAILYKNPRGNRRVTVSIIARENVIRDGRVNTMARAAKVLDKDVGEMTKECIAFQKTGQAPGGKTAAYKIAVQLLQQVGHLPRGPDYADLNRKDKRRFDELLRSGFVAGPQGKAAGAPPTPTARTILSELDQGHHVATLYRFPRSGVRVSVIRRNSSRVLVPTVGKRGKQSTVETVTQTEKLLDKDVLEVIKECIAFQQTGQAPGGNTEAYKIASSLLQHAGYLPKQTGRNSVGNAATGNPTANRPKSESVRRTFDTDQPVRSRQVRQLSQPADRLPSVVQDQPAQPLYRTQRGQERAYSTSQRSVSSPAPSSATRSSRIFSVGKVGERYRFLLSNGQELEGTLEATGQSWVRLRITKPNGKTRLLSINLDFVQLLEKVDVETPATDATPSTSQTGRT